jgi:hypothetical protein
MINISEHTISQSLATAIFNDDYSGICASDETAINNWLKGYITLNHDDIAIHWKQCEITGQWSDCIIVNQITE